MAMFSELRRRNIFRVALLYIAVAWLLLELGAIGVDHLGLPLWIYRFAFALLLICLPLALVFSWIYEITPEGLKREHEVLPGASITRETGRRLTRLTGWTLLAIVLINLVRLFVG